VKHLSLFVAAIGVILVLLSLPATSPTGAHPALQVTITPTVFDYLPVVLRNWPPPPTPTSTNTPTATSTSTQTPTPTHTSTATPSPTSTPFRPMFGIWRGDTNQSGKRIRFLIPGDASRVCGFSLNWSSSCGMTGGFSTRDTTCVPISPDADFTYVGEGTIFGSHYIERIEGDFNSVTTASGTFRHQEGSSCVVSGTWSASLTDEPTPTPRVCPAIRPGRWDGAASFTVPDDRSRVENFEFEMSFGTCGTVRYTASELPIRDCEISFGETSGGRSFGGNGIFTSETEIDGGASVTSSACAGSGTWHSWWVSSGE